MRRYHAEYVALTQLQADASVTLDQRLARAVNEIVTVWPALMPAPTGTQASPFPGVDLVPAETDQIPGRTAASRSSRSSSAVRRRP